MSSPSTSVSLLPELAVPFSSGSCVFDLLSQLWNNSASHVLQLISASLELLRFGSATTATYTAPQVSLSTASSYLAASQSSSREKAVAAVVLPLPVVVGQQTGKHLRSRHAIHHSMAFSARNSAFSFGAIRPSAWLQTLLHPHPPWPRFAGLVPVCCPSLRLLLPVNPYLATASFPHFLCYRAPPFHRFSSYDRFFSPFAFYLCAARSFPPCRAQSQEKSKRKCDKRAHHSPKRVIMTFLL